MSSKRKRKRKRRKRRRRSRKSESQPIGLFVFALWALTIVLIAATALFISLDMRHWGHSDVPLLWILMLAVLTGVAIMLTLRLSNPKSPDK